MAGTQRKLRAVPAKSAPAAKRKRAATSGNRVGRPATNLATVVGRSEREVLLVLQRKVAKMIDTCDKPTALAPLLRQFERYDQRIRAIDAAAAEAAEAEAEGDYGDDDDDKFDPDEL